MQHPLGNACDGGEWSNTKLYSSGSAVGNGYLAGEYSPSRITVTDSGSVGCPLPQLLQAGAQMQG